ncbi:uncharacterized protein [Drosophila pseudoobscura]|uniref:Uncharacterized protein n=1 Tax=Drosophila pseudoobscura pseudoobscura TaxID=46245 RepID=A0A6I8W081_DROPS|nr:uncharacterized protein LOC117184214 [Drosophila pseudoobscura]
MALDLLENRFNNRRLVFQAHINEILALQAVEPGSVVMLRELSDKFNSHMRALKGLGTTEQIAGCIVVQELHRKLDPASQEKWEERPRIRKLNSVVGIYGLVLGAAMQIIGDDGLFYGKLCVEQSARCALCNDGAHEVQHCQKFKALSPTNRHKEAKRLSLCINCLRTGHRLLQCTSSNCRTCGGRHHTLLHFGSPEDTAVQGK